MRSREFIGDERGAVSALGLCVLMVLVLLALACVHFMRGGNVLAAEYERETQLRLAAESAAETAVLRLERGEIPAEDIPAPLHRQEIDAADVPRTGQIELRVFLETPEEGKLYVIAVAIAHDPPHIDDGEDWQRAKIVRAYLEKKEAQRYAWRRFF